MPPANNAELRSVPVTPREGARTPRAVILAFWEGGSIVMDLPRTGGLVVGRDPGERGLLVTHRLVSRRHARIEALDGEVSIVDLGSMNGTRVDGRRLTPGEPVRIDPGVFVEIGEATLMLQPAWVGSLPPQR